MRLHHIVALGALLAIGGGIAAAAIPSSDGSVKTCYRKKGGAVRVVSASKRCKKSEKALVINQRGPQGTPGANGLQGAKGDKGDKGDAGDPGGQVTKINYRANGTQPTQTIYDSPGFSIEATCSGASGPIATVRGKVDHGSIATALI